MQFDCVESPPILMARTHFGKTTAELCVLNLSANKLSKKSGKSFANASSKVSPLCFGWPLGSSIFFPFLPVFFQSADPSRIFPQSQLSDHPLQCSSFFPLFFPLSLTFTPLAQWSPSPSPPLKVCLLSLFSPFFRRKEKLEPESGFLPPPPFCVTFSRSPLPLSGPVD